MTCPSCGEPLLGEADEHRWCSKCDWNLDPSASIEKQTVFQKISCWFGKKHGEQLFENLRLNNVTRPRLTIGSLAAFFIAGCVHFASVVLFLASLYLATYWPNPFAIIFALALFGAAIAVVPRKRRLPEGIVSRQRAPQIYSSLDKIADAMKTGRPYAVAISGEFNASYTEFGFFSKRKVITVGLPLASIATEEELIFLLAHETAHGANGDLLRGYFVGNAVDTLVNWHQMIAPTSWDEGKEEYSDFGGLLLAFPANIFRYLLSLIPHAICYVLAALLTRQSHEAEYLADRLATEIAGREAASSFLRKALNCPSFIFAAQKAAVSGSGLDFFGGLVEAVARISEREYERLSRLELKRGLSLDSSHPPLPFRAIFISKYSGKPSVVVSPFEARAIREELNSFKSEIGPKIIDQFRGYLY